jgi:hypothetical protein
MTPKRTRRNSKKPRALPLSAVNHANRWILLPGGWGMVAPRSAA